MPPKRKAAAPQEKAVAASRTPNMGWLVTKQDFEKAMATAITADPRSRTAQLEAVRSRVHLGKAFEAPTNFLKMLGQGRADVHRGFMEHVRGKLLDMIPTLSEERLGELLHTTFDYIAAEELRAVPLAALTLMGSVSEDILQRLAQMQQEQPEVFLACKLPASVQRAAWETSPQLFKAIAAPKIDEFPRHSMFPLLRKAAAQAAKQKPSFFTRGRRTKFDGLLSALLVPSVAAADLPSERLLGFTCDALVERFAEDDAAAIADATGSAAVAATAPPHAARAPGDGPLWCVLLTDLLFLAKDRRGVKLEALKRPAALAFEMDNCVSQGAFDSARQHEVQRLLQEALLAAVPAAVAAAAAAAAESARVAASDSAAKRLSASLTEAWRALTENDMQQRIFEVAVDPRYAPGYTEVVKRPMDLGTIEAKVQKRRYGSVQALAEDARLMFDNCKRYNGRETVYHGEALRQEAAFEDWLKDFNRRDRAAAAMAAGKQKVPRGGSGGAGGRRAATAASLDSNGGEANGGGDGDGATLKPLKPLPHLEPSAGIVAMAAAEPFFGKLLYRKMAAAVAECAETQSLPQEHESLPALAQMAAFGAAAAGMCRRESWFLAEPDLTLLRRGLPALLLLLAQAAAGGGTDAAFDSKKWRILLRGAAAVTAEEVQKEAGGAGPSQAAADGGDADGDPSAAELAGRTVLLRLLAEELTVRLATTDDAAVVALAAAMGGAPASAGNELWWRGLQEALRTSGQKLGEMPRKAVLRLMRNAVKRAGVLSVVHEQSVLFVGEVLAPPRHAKKRKRSAGSGGGGGGSGGVGEDDAAAATGKAGAEPAFSEQELQLLLGAAANRLLKAHGASSTFSVWESPAFRYTREAYRAVYRVRPEWLAVLGDLTKGFGVEPELAPAGEHPEEEETSGSG